MQKYIPNSTLVELPEEQGPLNCRELSNQQSEAFKKQLLANQKEMEQAEVDPMKRNQEFYRKNKERLDPTLKLIRENKEKKE